jgi:hypothetical protein
VGGGGATGGRAGGVSTRDGSVGGASTKVRAHGRREHKGVSGRGVRVQRHGRAWGVSARRRRAGDASARRRHAGGVSAKTQGAVGRAWVVGVSGGAHANSEHSGCGCMVACAMVVPRMGLVARVHALLKVRMAARAGVVGRAAARVPAAGSECDVACDLTPKMTCRWSPWAVVRGAVTLLP